MRKTIRKDAFPKLHSKVKDWWVFNLDNCFRGQEISPEAVLRSYNMMKSCHIRLTQSGDSITLRIHSNLWYVGNLV